MTSWQNDLAPN